MAYVKKGPRPLKTLAERLAGKWKYNPANGCWEWRRNFNDSGYGMIWMKRGNGTDRSERAHRLSWAAWRGPIPNGMSVLHRCDNRRCVNPDHLFLGTRADNVRDCAAKGRMPRGERHHASKLTAIDIIAIRHRCAKGEHQSSIAKEYGINQGTISEIVNRKLWVHVGEQP